MAHEIVETPEATFVLMFTRSHGAPNNPNKPVPFEKSPLKPDALLVETGDTKRPRLAESIFVPIHRKPLTQAYKNNAEVWFGDVPPTRATLERLNKTATMKSYFGGVVGLVLGAAGYWTARGIAAGVARKKAGAGNPIKQKKKQPEKKQGRRHFLETTFIGGIVGLLSGNRLLNAEMNARGHQEKIENPRYWSFMTKLHEQFSGFGIGPARNAVIAEKMHSVLIPDLRKKLGRKPVVVVAMGMSHYGLKQMIVDHEHRRRTIIENDLEYYLTKPFDDAYRGTLDLDAERLPLKPKLERIPKALSPRKPKQRKPAPGPPKIGLAKRSIPTPRSVTRKNALKRLPPKRRRVA